MKKDINAIDELAKKLKVTPEEVLHIFNTLEEYEKSGEGGMEKSLVQQNMKTPKKTYNGFFGGDISEVTSEDDFKDDELYQSLFAQGISKKLRRTLMYDLKKRAQEIGKRDLAKYFAERCEEKESELRNAIELNRMGMKEKEEWCKKTEYSDLPENCTGNKYIGAEWTATNDKAYTLEQHGDISRVVTACTQPVLINRILKPLDGEDEERRVEIIYKEGRYWHTSIVSLEVLLNSNKSVSLSSLGILITKKTAGAFSEFMASMYSNSLSKNGIPELYTVKQLGWTDDNKYFVPFVTDGKEIRFERIGKVPDLLSALEEKGNKVEWYAEYTKLRKTGYQPLKVLTAAMFASAILGLMNLDGFACNIFGTTTTGKTITTQIATSIWGDCRDSSDLIVSPKATAIALELRLGVLKNIPLIIDDTASLSVKEKAEFQSTLMQMANGKCKDRGNKDLSLRKTFSWKTVIIVTSEGRIDKDWTTGGSKGRVLGLENKEKPVYWDELDRIMEFFENNYGHAGRDFVKVLQQIGVDKVKKMYNGIHKILKEEAKKRGKMSRHAANVAFLVTADRIAEKYLFKDGVKISLEEAISLMSDEKEVDQPIRFYNTLIDTVYRNAGKFEGLTEIDDIRGEFWGVYKKYEKYEDRTVNTVSILPDVLKQLAEKADMDVKLFLTYLKKNNLLIADAGRNHTKETSKKLKGRIWMVKIILPDDSEKAEDTKISDNSKESKDSKVSEQQEEFVEPLTEKELEEMGFPKEWL